MKALMTVLLVAVICAAGRGAPAEADKPKPTVEYAPPFPIVMIPRTADAELESLAKQTAISIGVRQVGRSDYNPVCCIWIQIVRWLPNPGEGGYIIINQPGGSIIQATDMGQMKKAVDRFVATVHLHEGKLQVPLGMLTNYPVVD